MFKTGEVEYKVHEINSIFTFIHSKNGYDGIYCMVIERVHNIFKRWEKPVFKNALTVNHPSRVSKTIWTKRQMERYVTIT